eukprot:gene4395-4711_t
MSAGNECITVVVRCRPMNKKEKDESRKPIIEVDPDTRQVGIRNPEAGNEPPKLFTFDATYDDKTQQKFFYEESCFNIIESTLEGFNSTIFAYGQTGCGKSFTMQGPSTTDENLRGVIPNSFSHIFQFVKTTKNVDFLIRCSYLELYNEEIKDLLVDPKVATKCELKEDPNKGIYVKGLSDVVVETPEDLHKMLDKGLTNRTTASTNMNAESSRSHSIFTIIVEMNTKDETTGKDMLRVGKLNLVDLAGSERAKKTGATDKVLKEGIKINLSLSVLGNVISALAEGSKFIPYRDSKLTRLLQDSLGGNTKTMMVAAISPADYNYDETLSTLRYANRAKNIKNKPKINEDPKDTMIREFKAEIERLRQLLEQQANAATLLAQLQLPVAEGTVALQAPAASRQQQQQQHHQHQTQPSNHSSLAVIEEVVSEANSPVKAPRPSANSQAEVKSSVVEVTAANFTESNDTTIQQDAFSLGHDGVSPSSSVMTNNLFPNTAATPQFPENSNFAPSPQVLENDNFVPISQVPENIHSAPTHDIVQQNGNFIPATHQSENSVNGEVVIANANMEAITTPRDLEQQIRDEIENRLHQLEHMLVHSDAVTLSPQKETPAASGPATVTKTSSGSNKDLLNQTTVVVPMLQLTKTPEQIAEEERQIQLYKERKLQAKKRREEKQQREVQKILDEKKQVENELEELKQNLLIEKQQQQARPMTSEEDLEEFANKKVQKLKKRYEKKLAAAKEELEDLRDDFYYQRKQLMDAALEQEKDCKLYEIICRSLIGDRELKKIVDKCHYDDDKDEWVIPYIKRKNVDVEKLTGGATMVGDGNNNFFPVNSGGNSNNISSGGGGSSLFPDIYNPKDNISNNNSGPDRPASQARRVRSARSANGSRTTTEPQYSSNDPFQYQPPPQQSLNKGIGKGPMVPLLTLPGSLVSASSLISPKISTSTYQTGRNQPNSTSARMEDYYSNSNYNNSNNTSNFPSNGISLPGIGFANDNGNNNTPEEKGKKASKSKNKLPKATPATSNSSSNNNGNVSRSYDENSNRMPNITSHQQQNNVNFSNKNASSNSYQQASDYSNVDEQGTGETAGPLNDWGFANSDSIVSGNTTQKTKKASNGTSEDYNYYGHNNDDENYPNNNNYQYASKQSSHGTRKKKKANSMENSTTLPPSSSLFPPIDSKHQTPRGGGFSLPPI